MDGVELIAAERKRQVEEKGWDAAHDDTHEDGSLAMAAVNVANIGFGGLALGPAWAADLARHVKDKYPSDRVRQLAISGALIAAEIDRLQRVVTGTKGRR